MATAIDFRRIAMSLDGTVESPHFDRTAFKVARIYATVAADGLTANLRLTPVEQALKSSIHADAYAPVKGAWGKQGWTTVTLEEVNVAELTGALEAAWRHGVAVLRRKG